MYKGNQLARIHIGKKALGLDDDTYRNFLEVNTGKRSAKELTVQERQRIIYIMNQRGAFKKQKKTLTRQQKACVAKWYALREMGIVKSRDKSSLNRYIKKHIGGWSVADLSDRDTNRLLAMLQQWLRSEQNKFNQGDT